VKPPVIVAEVGANHRGELPTALRMIEIAAGYCREHFRLDGVRPDVVVKFQKRTPRASPDDFKRPHPNAAHAYGATYGAHREALELSRADHVELSERCRELGVGYASSVWDWHSAEDICRLLPRPAWVKIPSAKNLDTVLIEKVLGEWPGEVHISLGMITRAEQRGLVDLLVKLGVSKRVVLYVCTSAYPAEPEHVRLGEIEWMTAELGPMVKSIGFSGHHAGIAIDMAAAAMGVSHIERHFTLNRTWKGTDHAASLEPDGLRRLIRDVGTVTRALGDKGDGLLDVEAEARERLRGASDVRARTYA
jgi:N-acetylneuraminate synthase